MTEFVYTTYIKTTPEKLWNALTNPEFIRQYWFGAICESDFKTGSPWKLCFPDGKVADAGEILESVSPRRLVIKWQNEWNPDFKAEGYSQCTFDIEPDNGAIKLTIIHSMDKISSKLITEGVSKGWPKVLSNLKSLLEMGKIAVEYQVDCRTKVA